jgi:hypothetical protein
MTERSDDDAEQRRRIIRTATLYTYGLFAVTMLVALGGAALVALIVRIPTLSYVQEWLAISAIVLLPSAFGLLIQRYRESRRRARRPPDPEE